MNEFAWVERNIPSLNGKVAVITGANSGIGFEAARVLTQKGAKVILACRNAQKAATARQHILNEYPGGLAEVMELNLSDLSSVQEFAMQLREKHQQLHLLINNAGVMALPYSLTTDGFEMQFGTNHLGHFALTALLFPLLKNTPGSRVISISSAMHQYGKMDFNNLNYEHGGYNNWAAYGRSKLANLLFIFELNKRLHLHNAEILAIAAHPGYSATNLQQAGINNDNKLWKQWMVSVGNKLLGTSALFGALPTLYAATNNDLQGGEYVGPTGFLNMRGVPGKNPSSAKSRDPKAAEQLWQMSEELTRISFPI